MHVFLRVNPQEILKAIYVAIFSILLELHPVVIDLLGIIEVRLFFKQSFEQGVIPTLLPCQISSLPPLIPSPNRINLPRYLLPVTITFNGTIRPAQLLF